jgi:hypothetical protein
LKLGCVGIASLYRNMRGIVVALALMAAAPAAAFFSAAPALMAAKARTVRPLIVEMASTSGEMGIPCEDE